MAVVLPFAALRPPAELAERVAAPPYDVMDVAEARAMAAGNEHSFLHVSRPEIDLPADVEPHADEVYEQGRSNLEAFVQQGWLVADPVPTYSVYRQRMGAHVQTGVVGVASVDDYESGLIAKHEHTRPDKELDRVRHIDALGAQDEPVFLLYDRSAGIQDVIARVVARPADVSFASDDGIEHTLWVVADVDDLERLRARFAEVPRMYIADGHHRSAAAAQVRGLRRSRTPLEAVRTGAADALLPSHVGPSSDVGPASGVGPPSDVVVAGGVDRPDDVRVRGEGWRAHDGFLVVAFAGDELQVLPYHRVVCDLDGVTSQTLMDGLRQSFDVAAVDGPPEPSTRHVIGMHLAGSWYRLELRPGVIDEADAVARLDVSVLQDLVLAPLLGIADPRTDPRLRFVGGIRGTAELERLVESGEAAVAFAMHPTSVGDLQALSDADLIMPPKSTWFEPKLRSGLFVHPLDP